jgi:protein-disulfide isomerase
LKPALVLSCLASLAGCAPAASPPPAPPPAPPAAAAPASAPVASSAPGAAPGAASTPGEEDAGVPIFARNPTWGSRTAPVTIVEFADYQCPFCARAEPTMARIRAAYGPEVVRLVWKNLPMPFHESARPAAEAAMGVFALAGAEAFWKFHDAAFQDQGALSDAHYEAWARAAGVTDMSAWRAGLVSHRWAGDVDADVRDAENLGVSGTPTFLVNGVRIIGAEPFEQIKTIIDQQIQAAKTKIAAGTPPERVYAVLSRENVAEGAKAAADQDGDGPPEDTKTVFKVPLGKSPARGPASALVTIVEFADYQCPFSGRAEPTLAALRRKYGDELRIVFKNEPVPFHPRAEPAAEAALEVRAEKGDAAFWEMHDALFASQSELGDDALVKLAVSFGARADKVKAAIAHHTHQREIDDDVDLADDFQASGTPHFFIDGRRLRGAQPEQKFEAIIDEEIGKARQLLAQGTRPEAVYDALVKDGQDPPPPERKDVPASLPSGDPARGNPAAKVTVHEWSDFQCPYCAGVEPTIDRVMKEYGTRIKLVWHDLPLPMHPDAPLAAQAAREALRQKGPKAFWSLHDQLFGHPQALARDVLDGYARGLGLDMAKWKAALDSGSHAGEIDADAKAADEAGFSGTPSFLLVPAGSKSGYVVIGAQGFARFRRLIERALAEAK